MGQVFVEDMMEHPNNGYALLGVSQALRALGRDADADQLHGVFQVSSSVFSLPVSLHFLSTVMCMHPVPCRKCAMRKCLLHWVAAGQSNATMQHAPAEGMAFCNTSECDCLAR